jgi:hypothetical protein
LSMDGLVWYIILKVIKEGHNEGREHREV